MASNKSHYCLFCWKPLNNSLIYQVFSCAQYIPIIPIQNTPAIQHKLNQWFILKQLLNVPAEWSENKIKNSSGPEDWFQVCQECLDTIVANAWKINLQILQLERKMTQLREVAKQKMLAKATSTKIQRIKNGIDMEIRNLVVPELATIFNRQESGSPEIQILVKEEQESENESSDVSIKVEEKSENESEDSAENIDIDEEPEMNCADISLSPNNEEELPDPLELDNESHGNLQTNEQELSSPKKTPKQPNKKRRFQDPNKTERSFRDRGKDRMKRKRRGTGPRKNDKPKQITHPCPHCKAVPFLTPEELQAHENLHTDRKLNPAMDTNGKSLDCDQCSFPARDQQELTLHIRTRHEKGYRTTYPCPLHPECPKLPETWHKMLSHITRCHTEEAKLQYFQKHIYCDQCDFKGKMPVELKSHKKHCHKKPAPLPVVNPENVLKCQDCGILCADEKDLKKHVNNEHRRINRFVCCTCGKGFMDKHALTSHEATHTKHLKRDWICDICGMDYPRKSTLLWHQREYHSEETMKKVEEGKQEFKCRYCNLTSPFAAVIKKHLETHKEQGEWKCKKCGKCYINRQGLNRHMRIKHNEKEEVFKCPHCQKGFGNLNSVQCHVRKSCKLKSVKKGENSLEGGTIDRNDMANSGN